MKYYVRVGDGDPQILTPEQIYPLVQAGKLHVGSKACAVGATSWTNLGQLLPSLFSGDAPPPPGEEGGAMEFVGKAGQFIAEHGGEVAGLANVFARRIFSSNFITESALPEEREQLEKAEIPVKSPMAQNYAAWRRAILWISGVALGLAGLLAFIDEFSTLFSDGIPPALAFMAWGLQILNIAAPVLVILAALRWTKLRRSRRLARIGWAAGFLGPLVLFFIPVGSITSDEELATFYVEQQWVAQKKNMEEQFSKAPDKDKEGMRKQIEQLEKQFRDSGRKEQIAQITAPEFADKLKQFKLGVAGIMSLLAVYTLAPRIFGLFPGIVRASLTLRTLVPESPLPGYVIALIEPLYMVFILLLVVVAAQAGNTLAFFGLVTMLASTIMLIREVKTLAQPMDPASMNAHLKPLRKRVITVAMIGLVILLSGLETLLKQMDWMKITTAVLHLVGSIFLLTSIASDFFISLMKFSFDQEKKLQGSPLYADMERRFVDLQQVRLTQISDDEDPAPAPPVT